MSDNDTILKIANNLDKNKLYSYSNRLIDLFSRMGDTKSKDQYEDTDKDFESFLKELKEANSSIHDQLIKTSAIRWWDRMGDWFTGKAKGPDYRRDRIEKRVTEDPRTQNIQQPQSPSRSIATYRSLVKKLENTRIDEAIDKFGQYLKNFSKSMAIAEQEALKSRELALKIQGASNKVISDYKKARQPDAALLVEDMTRPINQMLNAVVEQFDYPRFDGTYAEGMYVASENIPDKYAEIKVQAERGYMPEEEDYDWGDFLDLDNDGQPDIEEEENQMNVPPQTQQESETGADVMEESEKEINPQLSPLTERSFPDEEAQETRQTNLSDDRFIVLREKQDGTEEQGIYYPSTEQVYWQDEDIIENMPIEEAERYRTIQRPQLDYRSQADYQLDVPKTPKEVSEDVAEQAQNIFIEGREKQNSTNLKNTVQQYIDMASQGNAEALEKASELMFWMWNNYDESKDPWLSPMIKWYQERLQLNQLPYPSAEGQRSPLYQSYKEQQEGLSNFIQDRGIPGQEEQIQEEKEPQNLDQLFNKLGLSVEGFEEYGGLDQAVENALRNPAGIGVQGINNKQDYMNFIQRELQSGASEEGFTLRDYLGDNADEVISEIIELQNGSLKGYEEFKEMLSRIPAQSLKILQSPSNDAIDILMALAEIEDSSGRENIGFLENFKL